MVNLQIKYMSENLLYRTYCYLPGAMENVNGEGWRNDVKELLKDRNIIFLDPYHKPFIDNVPEDDNSRKEMIDLRESEQYDQVTQKMKKVRGYDLRCIDKSDWFIGRINPKIASWGTAEELSVIVRQQKCIFLVVDSPNGKRDTPLWLLAMIPHQYIYSSMEDAIKDIKSIDDGVLVNDRLKLLRKEYR